MRLLISVLILASVGCASPPATAPTATSPYVSEVTNAGDPAEDVICRFENKENSRMRERVCATRAERTQHAEKSRARIKQR